MKGDIRTGSTSMDSKLRRFIKSRREEGIMRKARWSVP